MFHTDTKQNATSITYDEICEITSSINIPVVAIGGINEENVLKLKGTGVDGIAVISAIFASEDICKATSNLLALSKELIKND